MDCEEVQRKLTEAFERGGMQAVRVDVTLPASPGRFKAKTVQFDITVTRDEMHQCNVEHGTKRPVRRCPPPSRLEHTSGSEPEPEPPDPGGGGVLSVGGHAVPDGWTEEGFDGDAW